MDSDLFLLDSSIWIRYLRATGPADLTTAVQTALARGQIATCAVVNAELLVGSRDDGDFRALADMLRALDDVPMTPRLWDQAALLGYSLRRRGAPMGLPDLMIAQCAITSQRVLWHTDAVFERVKQHSDLQTRPWA